MVKTDVPGAVADFVAAGPDAVLGYTIARVAHAIEREIDGELRRTVGLGVRQFGALAHLDRNPGLGSGALGRLLLVTPQSAGAMVEGLERSGDIARDRSAGPGRVAGVALTASGKAKLARAYRVAAAVETRLAAALPSGTTAALNAQLLALLDGLAATDG